MLSMLELTYPPKFFFMNLLSRVSSYFTNSACLFYELILNVCTTKNILLTDLFENDKYFIFNLNCFILSSFSCFYCKNVL